MDSDLWHTYHDERPAADELFIWLLDFERLGKSSRFEVMLTEEERNRAARFYFEKDRRAFTITRGYLKERLQTLSGLPVADRNFEFNSQGKPYLKGSSFFFNVSHSGKKALVALTPLAPVGVDVEAFRPDMGTEKIARRFFSEKEVGEFNALPPEQRTQGFFNAWTRKEAFIKAAGLGLSMPLHSFDVTLTPGREARLTGARHPGYDARDWHLEALPLAPPYAAAYCIKHTSARVRLWLAE